MGNADLRFSTEAKKNHLPPSRDSDLLNDAASPVTVLVVQMAKLRPNSLVIQDVRDSLNCHSQSRFKPQPSHGRRNGCSGPQSGLSESGRAGSVAEISLQTTLPTNWRMCDFAGKYAACPSRLVTAATLQSRGCLGENSRIANLWFFVKSCIYNVLVCFAYLNFLLVF